jgi:hypothetical protein
VCVYVFKHVHCRRVYTPLADPSNGEPGQFVDAASFALQIMGASIGRAQPSDAEIMLDVARTHTKPAMLTHEEVLLPGQRFEVVNVMYDNAAGYHTIMHRETTDLLSSVHNIGHQVCCPSIQVIFKHSERILRIEPYILAPTKSHGVFPLRPAASPRSLVVFLRHLHDQRGFGTRAYSNTVHFAFRIRLVATLPSDSRSSVLQQRNAT